MLLRLFFCASKCDFGHAGSLHYLKQLSVIAFSASLPNMGCGYSLVPNGQGAPMPNPWLPGGYPQAVPPYPFPPQMPPPQGMPPYPFPPHAHGTTAPASTPPVSGQFGQTPPGQGQGPPMQGWYPQQTPPASPPPGTVPKAVPTEPPEGTFRLCHRCGFRAYLREGVCGNLRCEVSRRQLCLLNFFPRLLKKRGISSISFVYMSSAELNYLRPDKNLNDMKRWRGEDNKATVKSIEKAIVKRKKKNKGCLGRLSSLPFLQLGRLSSLPFLQLVY